MKSVCRLAFFLPNPYIYVNILNRFALMKRRREKWKIRNDNL